MSKKYYLVSYIWSRTRGREWNRGSEVWAGSMGEWMLKAIQQPEEWHLVDHAEISHAEFEELDGRL